MEQLEVIIVDDSPKYLLVDTLLTGGQTLHGAGERSDTLSDFTRMSAQDTTDNTTGRVVQLHTEAGISLQEPSLSRTADGLVVKYFVDGNLRSIGVKRNIAVRHARGTFIMHWDDDDLYGPDRIRAQVLPIHDGLTNVTMIEHQAVTAVHKIRRAVLSCACKVLSEVIPPRVPVPAGRVLHQDGCVNLGGSGLEKDCKLGTALRNADLPPLNVARAKRPAFH